MNTLTPEEIELAAAGKKIPAITEARKRGIPFDEALALVEAVPLQKKKPAKAGKRGGGK